MHRLVRNVQRLKKHAKPLYYLLNPLSCDFFSAIVVCNKVPAVVAYEKSQCRLISVPLASIVAI